MFRSALLVSCLALTCAEAAEPVAKAPASRSRFVDLFDDPVIARGQGVEVKQSALDESFIALKANLAARGQTVPEEHRRFREAQLLERLIVTQILGKRATTQDVAKAKEGATKFATETPKAAQSDEAFQRMLKSLGITGEKFERAVTVGYPAHIAAHYKHTASAAIGVGAAVALAHVVTVLFEEPRGMERTHI